MLERVQLTPKFATKQRNSKKRPGVTIILSVVHGTSVGTMSSDLLTVDSYNFKSPLLLP